MSLMPDVRKFVVKTRQAGKIKTELDDIRKPYVAMGQAAADLFDKEVEAETLKQAYKVSEGA
jgi:hypothetical protein